MANAEIELYPILATAAPCIYLRSAIANKELYILETHGFTPEKKKWPGRDSRACCARDAMRYGHMVALYVWYQGSGAATFYYCCSTYIKLLYIYNVQVMVVLSFYSKIEIRQW